MAAEYESDEAAAEEISQLLYHLQVLMIAKGLTPGGRVQASLATHCVANYRLSRARVPIPIVQAKDFSPCLELPSPTRDPCPRPPPRCWPRPATASAAIRANWSWWTRTTTSSSSSCARATSPSTSAPGTLDVGITGRDLLLDAQVAAEERCRWASPRPPSASPARWAEFSTVQDLEGKRLATSYDGLLRDFLDRARHQRQGGPARRRRGVLRPARRRGRHRRRRRDRHHAQGRRHGDLRRADPEVRGRADRPPQCRRLPPGWTC